MTIGKIFFKAVVLSLTLSLLLPMLFSCTANLTEAPPFELLENSSDSTGYSLYRIVIPSTCSSELFLSAKTLKGLLYTQTGVNCEVVFDQDETPQGKNTFDLVLGNSTHTAAKKATQELRSEDYLCRLQDGVLVLGGRSEQATQTAIRRYCDELLVHATATSLLPNEAGFLYRAEYTVQPISLGNFDLALFDILHDKDASEHAVLIAKALKTKIEETAYYSLRVQSQSEFDGLSKRICLILSEEETEGVAHIRFDEYGVILSAKDLFGLSAVAKEFYHRLIRTPETSEDFGLSNPLISVNYEQTGLSLASILFTSNGSSVDRLTAMSNLVLENFPELVLFGNLSQTERSHFEELLASQYELGSSAAFLRGIENCRRIQTLGATTELYQIGNEIDGFLLLATTEPPSEELLSSLSSNPLPLLVILNTQASDRAWTTQHLDRVVFVSADPSSFAIFAEPNCFLVRELLSESGYRSFSIERTSAFYFPSDY